MGNETKRCLKVDGLRKELRRLDGDLIVRFRDGDVKYPGIYLMREDRTDHVNIGSPYPVRGRLAELDRKVRKAGGRRPPKGPQLWAVVARVEREEQSQVVESVDIHVLPYRDKLNALRGAKREFAKLYRSLTRESFSRHPDRAAIEIELCEALSDGRSYFLDATEGDIIVVFMRKLEVKE